MGHGAWSMEHGAKSGELRAKSGELRAEGGEGMKYFITFEINKHFNDGYRYQFCKE